MLYLPTSMTFMLDAHREARCQMLGLHLGSPGVSISDEDLNMLSQCTEGYSGSDIAHVASEALMRPLRELEAASYWLPAPAGLLQPCAPSQPGALQMRFTDLAPHQVFILPSKILYRFFCMCTYCLAVLYIHLNFVNKAGTKYAK